ncbi:hypothetical protein Tco_1165308 [Tanacetum coccineum]
MTLSVWKRGLTLRPLTTQKKTSWPNIPLPQTQLTPEQVFWSLDLAKRKAEELKANATPLPVLPPATVYPPNTPAHLVPRTLPTISQVNIGLYVITQLFWDFKKTCKKHITPTGITEGERVTEVRAMKAVFDNLEAEVDQNETDLRSGEIERKNLLITNENLVAECLSKDVFYTNVLETKNPGHLRSPSFDSLFVIGKLNEQIQSRGNTIRELKEKISRLTKKNSDADPIFDLKALDQLKENSKCVTIPDYEPKVLTPSRYPIDVEPIPPRLKKNREVHLHYIERLKENVETLREIVEDAKVERPLDTSLASACRYTKHSQELLEYVIGTCPKDFGPRNKQNASTNSLRKKGVTFVEPHETSTHNTPPQVEHQKINSTNVPGIPSTGVKGASTASRSKPRSNTKKDRTLPAKSALKQVEAHSRMNKSNEKHKNRVDSSINYKRTIINSNSNTSCKTCNTCLIYVNHDQCVVRSEMCVKQSSTTKTITLGDQWPLTRNTSPKVLPTKQWKPTGRLLPLGRQSDYLPADPQETIAPVVLIVLWYLDSGCSKHMTGDRSRLRNFMKKFIGTVRFENDHFGAMMGYGD